MLGFFSLCLLAVSNSATAWAQSVSSPTSLLEHVRGLAPLITPSPTITATTRTSRQRRDVLSDIRSGADAFGNDVSSVLASLGSAVPSYVASGVPDFFQGFPTGDAVRSSLGLDDSQVQALPTQVLNLPPYANWTDSGWNVRFHGNVYKQPNISSQDLDRLTNLFLPDVDVDQLPPDQAAQARNLTSEIFVLQQSDERPIFNLAPVMNPSVGGAQGTTGGSQQIQVPYNTTAEGDYDVFLPIQLDGLRAGNETTKLQELQVHTQGTDTGNATAYLVPPGPGLTVVSDIDDILRVTKIYEPEEGLLNSFARPFTPWLNMPDVYQNWSQSLALGDNATYFHYLTTTPEQVTRNYMSFIFATYPAGSFDTRPLNFSDVEATLSIRQALLTKIFETFPQRKFILVADTSNSDVMRDYPRMATDHPQQVQCIFLRNTSATDPGDHFPYDTSGFKGIDKNKYMFFVTPDDLMGLDIANGQCLNASVPQNVTFGYQGLPFGVNLGDGDDGGSSAPSSHNLHRATVAAWLVAALLAAWHAL